jgi:sugar/nucleoside kinase (ribokinase family)
VVDHRLRRVLADLQQVEPDKLIYVDSRRHLSEFAFGILKCNRSELLGAAGETATDDAALARAASQLSARTGRPVFCTLGEEGILVSRPGQPPSIAPAYPVSGPIDIVGAGDSATSGIVASLLAEADELSAAAVGNLIASITVQQLGTTGTASPEQVRERWRQVEAAGG